MPGIGIGISPHFQNKRFSFAQYWVTPFDAEAETGDGLSYATAWNGFTNIDWSAMSAGDTLYVCGTHNETLTLGINGLASKYFTIRGDYAGAAGVIDGEDTRDICLDVNVKTYIHIEAITLTQAVVSCLHVDGVSIVTTKDIVTSESGNQGVQHLNTCHATHTNLTTINNVDDGVSGHDSAIIIINGLVATGNAEGVSVIADAHCTITGPTTFSGNTSYDIYATAATGVETAWIDITGAILPTGSLAAGNGKIIMRNCVDAGTAENRTGYLYYYDSRVTRQRNYRKNLYAERSFFSGETSTGHIIDTLGNGGAANITLKYCVFKGMASAKFGVALRTGSTGIVKHCTFVGASNVGAGIFAQVNLTAENCIFTDLSAGINRNAGTVVANNCCFYDNTADVVGTVTQDASQTGDPALVNVATNDFSLGAGSSCIGNGKDLGDGYDEGINTADWGDGSTAIPLVTTKEQAAAWDIGAYIS